MLLGAMLGIAQTYTHLSIFAPHLQPPPNTEINIYALRVHLEKRIRRASTIGKVLAVSNRLSIVNTRATDVVCLLALERLRVACSRTRTSQGK